MKTLLHTLAITLIFSALSTSAYTPPALQDSLPQLWVEDEHFAETLPGSDSWWETFHDATLDSLVCITLHRNNDVSMALRRIELADLSIRQAMTSAWPTLSASGGWSMSQSSGAAGKTVVPSSQASAFSLGVNMSWEIDAFGRVAAQRKLAKANRAVTKADTQAVLSSLVAEVAKAYVQLRLYQAQMQVASDHILHQEKILNIAEARFECGLASMLDVTQSRIVLYSTRSTIPALEALVKNAVSALAILCGDYPDQLGLNLRHYKPLPDPFGAPVATGVPADMLRRRPDVVEAEKELAVYAAQIGVAKKDFLPVLSLSGSIGTSAHKLTNLFGDHSMTWSVAPQLSWTVFDGFARNYNVREARLNLENGIDNYNLVVMNAWQEVQSTMNTYLAALKTVSLDEEVVTQSKKELQLSVDLYKRGLSDFTNVVNAQMDWLKYQNNLLSERASALTSLISLYQALGGTRIFEE